MTTIKGKVQIAIGTRIFKSRICQLGKKSKCLTLTSANPRQKMTAFAFLAEKDATYCIVMANGIVFILPLPQQHGAVQRNGKSLAAEKPVSWSCTLTIGPSE